RALLFSERERGHVGRYPPRSRRIVDAGEPHVGIGARDLVHVARENEAHADDEIEPTRGEQAERGLAVFGARGLEVAGLHTELLDRARYPEVRGVVEALVTAAADVEHQPDARGGSRVRRRGLARSR